MYQSLFNHTLIFKHLFLCQILDPVNKVWVKILVHEDFAAFWIPTLGQSPRSGITESGYRAFVNTLATKCQISLGQTWSWTGLHWAVSAKKDLVWWGEEHRHEA